MSEAGGTTAVLPHTPAKDVDAPKLFFGQLPRGMDDGELRSFCEEFGPVFDAVILKDQVYDSRVTALLS
jgi:hypothetical protein